jgi:hypothetical protein
MVSYYHNNPLDETRKAQNCVKRTMAAIDNVFKEHQASMEHHQHEIQNDKKADSSPEGQSG